MSKIIFEMDIKEKWKKIKDYPYKISNLGRVKRIESDHRTFIGKILKLNMDTCGYLYVTFCKNGCRKNFLVHRLVAEIFLGSCPKDKEVNHIDGNKQNPHVDNLEYVTRSENIKHAYKLGLRRGMKGEKSPVSKLKEKDVKKIRKLYKTGNYLQKEIAKMFNVTTMNISKIVCRESWNHIK